MHSSCYALFFTFLHKKDLESVKMLYPFNNEKNPEKMHLLL